MGDDRFLMIDDGRSDGFQTVGNHLSGCLQVRRQIARFRYDVNHCDNQNFHQFSQSDTTLSALDRSFRSSTHTEKNYFRFMMMAILGNMSKLSVSKGE